MSLGRRFYFFWLGESTMQFAAALMSFALGVWVYRQSGSVTAFSNTVIAATLPSVLILPFAGGLADRLDRKRIIVAADAALALLTLLLLALLLAGRLQPLHLYMFNGCASAVGAFRGPAYQASVGSLVTKDGLTRANGLIGIGKNVSTLAAPLLGGIIMGGAGLQAVFAIHFVASVAAMLCVLAALGRLGAASVEPACASRPLLHDVLTSLASARRFFEAEPLLLGLLVYVMLQSALISLATMMIAPLVLAQHSSAELGFVYTWAALGGLAGMSLLVAATNPQRLMLIVVCADTVLSLCMLSIGLASSTSTYCAIAFVALAAGSVAEGCCNALWMRKIQARNRASVLSCVSMLMIATMTIVVAAGGFVVDRVLEPALAAGGAFAQAAHAWFGIGAGGGVALLFVVAGAASVLLCACMFAHPRMRRIDLLVPDEAC
ncbi:aminotransferase class III [Burkholderia stagnalis]|uniref:MFS transporter n=1 Tax=Burkholderia stagnalis TaxID=1503054 RepID=UPI0007600BCC|nr:MFS transporter [Burkholderia stagnalis]KWK50722.1 aminotransferase class III [Burkholderia stagnalis]KWK51854.1 aminotransferase class III [Burkholderia stagnalis]KWN66948.1 aminotransferase class III [Burkholderia stagnalis]